MPEFVCHRCGRCCGPALWKDGRNTATEGDVATWIAARRWDILQYARPSYVGRKVFGYDIWFHPKTGRPVKRCPFLRKVRGQERYACAIQDLKPNVCRRYPEDPGHAARTGCPGWSGGPRPAPEDLPKVADMPERSLGTAQNDGPVANQGCLFV
jgi:Fe-S-cluster containining protein